jgi:hypothetical protein
MSTDAENGRSTENGRVDPAPPESTAPSVDIDSLEPNDDPLPVPDQTQDDDSLLDIGRDAALAQLKAARKVVASEAFQNRLVPQVNRVVDVPYMPDSLEGKAMDMAYDLVQKPAVTALDELIDELQE